MTYSEPARTTTRRIPRIRVAGLHVVIAAIAAALGYRLLASSSARAASPIDILGSEHRGAALATGPESPHARGSRDRGPAPTRSTAQKRKRPDRSAPPPLLLTCRGTRSTLGPTMPRRGCPNTAPSTAYARSTVVLHKSLEANRGNSEGKQPL